MRSYLVTRSRSAIVMVHHAESRRLRRQPLNAHKLNLVDSESILKLTEQVVQHAAKRGSSVIVGRGSQHFLRDRPDTLRVFLYAPKEAKVRRVMARGKSQSEAEQLVDSVDRERADFIQTYCGVEWPNRGIYHLMMNTAVGDEAVVHMILEFMKAFDPTTQRRCLTPKVGQ